MKAQRFLGLILVLVVLAGALNGATGTWASTAGSFPSAHDSAEAPTTTGVAATARTSPIIADHTTTNLSQIPSYWIEQAKSQLRLAYGHTSHGSQIVTGIGVLDPGGLGGFNGSSYDAFDDYYHYLYGGPGNPVAPPGTLSLWDQRFSGASDLGNPNYTAWYTATRNMLNDSRFSNRNVIVWSWCGQADTSPQNIDLYLNLMSSLEAEYPNVTFVYMTGHLVGTGATGNLSQRNDQIRNHVRVNNGVLFDFADIESYDPDGNGYLDRRANDNCDYDSDGNGSLDKNWATSWCAAHSGDPLCSSCSCAHSQSLNCNLKVRAFWWLLARLAGWPGSSSQPVLSISKGVVVGHNPALPGDPITFTIVVRNTGTADAAGVRITDTLPSHVVGANLDTTRVVTAGNAITLTMSATVAGNVPAGIIITNTAVLTHASGGSFARAGFAVSALLPDLSASAKTVDTTTVQAGELVTFTLVLSNTGSVSATVRYTDTLPAQVDWVSGDLSGTAIVNAGTFSPPQVIVARAKRDLPHGNVFGNMMAIHDGVRPVFNIASPGVTVLAPNLRGSPRTVSKSVFEPGELITYALMLNNSGGVSTTVRYTVTLPGEVDWVSGALSGTAALDAGQAGSPIVIVAQVHADLETGDAFQARVDIADDYHPAFALHFPMTAVRAFLTRLPVVTRNYIAVSRQMIIIDHTCTDISKIPPSWLAQAKMLALHYAHTSHGLQINQGIEWLEATDSRYSIAIQYSGTPDVPAETNAVRLYDGNNLGWPLGDVYEYVTPDLYWSTPEGLTNTRSVAGTGKFHLSMWAWCGQQSDNSEETVQQYLGALDQLEQQYPWMRFVYMTGHTDGTGEGGTLYQNNELVRQYVRDRGKVLFDFADIESYDPDGNYYPDTDDSCPWCYDWCDNNPGTCENLPGSCEHSHPFNCKLKAQAFWWMMARLAGWNGVTQ